MSIFANISKDKLAQTARYVCTALVATIVNVVSRIGLSKFLPFEVSVVISYLIGHIVNYLLSATFAFRTGGNNLSLKTFLKFSLVACGGLVVTFVVSALALRLLQRLDVPLSQELRELAAHVCAIGCSFVCNYAGHVLFSFRNAKPASAAPAAAEEEA